MTLPDTASFISPQLNSIQPPRGGSIAFSSPRLRYQLNTVEYTAYFAMNKQHLGRRTVSFSTPKELPTNYGQVLFSEHFPEFLI